MRKKQNHRRTPLKKQYAELVDQTNIKLKENGAVECALPMSELLSGIGKDIERFSAGLGLRVMRAVMDHEIEQRLGEHGSQSYYRHGEQNGYVIFGGRKAAIERPRMRAVKGKEAQLESYKAFQENGRRQHAVARQMMRQCSTRNYEGVLDDCLAGYGIKKSSVSRQWKAATASELQKLCNRPIPRDLVGLIIDGKHLKRDCVVVALGVNGEGEKQVLGLWHGATENTTVVKGLLEDLVERGLDASQPLLVVIDGAKALSNAVRSVFGDRARIQRCRIHKLRNVVEHLPKEKQVQAAWRLKSAWAETDPKKALVALQKVVQWLESISPGAARSLEEGLEETLTVTRLGLHPHLLKTFASTNLIESCFSRTEDFSRRVKRWRNGKMFLRWSATALLFAEKGFRKVRGYRYLGLLKQALQNQHLDEERIAA
jgi:putative transposase